MGTLESFSVGVVGGGLMGHGIAQVFAVAGAEVRVYDPEPGVQTSLHARVSDNLRTLEMPIDYAQNIILCTQLDEAVSNVTMVIEAAPEDLSIKQSIFSQLNSLTTADCILASNTSVLQISEVTAPVICRERVLGTHWWNPPYLVPLVEVVQTPDTAPDVLSRVIGLLRAIGKTPVHIRADIPGLVGNRLQHALWREAFELIDSDVCDAETIDTVVKEGFGMRLAVLGPTENADLVGLDLTLSIHEYLLPTLDPPSVPAAGLRRRVAEGDLGMRSGAGFRRWTAEESRAINTRLLTHLAKLSHMRQDF